MNEELIGSSEYKVALDFYRKFQGYAYNYAWNVREGILGSASSEWNSVMENSTKSNFLYNFISGLQEGATLLKNDGRYQGKITAEAILDILDCLSQIEEYRDYFKVDEEIVNNINNLIEKKEILYKKWKDEDRFSLYSSLREFVEFAGKCGGFLSQDFFAWLFDDPTLKGARPWTLPSELSISYKKFLDSLN